MCVCRAGSGMQPPERRDLNTRAAWKSHIVRQLRLRDRSQHSAFQELIQSYHKLLEKSIFLKDLTEQIQTEPLASPGGHHAARVPPDVPHSPGPEDLSTLHKEMAELRISNGELAFEACELRKRIQDKDNRLKKQNTSINMYSKLVEGHEGHQQCLEREMIQMVCANADLKEAYDNLLSQRVQVEKKLQSAEEEQRENIGKMTKVKAMEAEQQNLFNKRRNDEIWTHIVRRALRKTVSAEPDVYHNHCTDSHDCSSLDVSVSQESERPLLRTTRSQSVIALGSSKFMGAIKSFFDLSFRKERAENYADVNWCRPCSVCVICCLPKRALYSKEVHESEIHAVKFSPNSKMVATGGADRVVKIWNVVGGQLQEHQVLEGSNGGITSIEFDPSGTQVLAASFDGSALLWKLDNKSSDSLTGHKGKVTAARFKMSAYRAVTCGMDRTVREWDLNKAAYIRCIHVSSYCSDVVCSDSYVISGHHDKKIRFWDTRSEVCVREVTLEEKITSLYLDPDQTQLLSCSRDDALSLIDLRMGNVRQVFRADGFKCGCDWTKAILSPDASYSVVGSSDGTIFIWNIRTGLLERSLNGEHSSTVNAVAWSVSGDYMVSVDRGRRAVLWSEY